MAAPTASYQEHHVIEQVCIWAKSRKIDFSQDSVGNVLLRYTGTEKRNRKLPSWVFAAHMDHPGFIVTGESGGKIFAEFLGNVGEQYFKNGRVSFFCESGQAAAKVISISKTKKSPFLQCRLELAKPVKFEIPAGTIGMWDLAPYRFSNDTLYSRGCDDVVGCAAVLCAMDDLVENKINPPCGQVLGLLTRAEEVGFIGALGACRNKTLPANSLVVAIETSKAQPAAPLGGGAIVRVGDSLRTFDSTLTAHVSAVAKKLAASNKNFRFTRQLMPGGACESTAYGIMGYCATGLCIPLGNYHNQGAGNKVAPEKINLNDFDSLVKLLAALAKDDGNIAKTDSRLKKRLEDLIKNRGGYL